MLQINGRRIEGVAFDLEGTVVDLEPLHFAAHVEVARSLEIELDLDDTKTFTDYLPHFIGGPDEKVIEDMLALAEERGIWRARSEELGQQMFRALLNYDVSIYRNLRDSEGVEIKPREGFINAFEQIRTLGLPVAIGSLTGMEDAEVIIKKSGLDNLFREENIILREHISKPKPDPEVYIRTAERMGILPEHQLVFDDSHNGIRAARDAGSVPIGMPTRQESELKKRMLDAGAVLVFERWGDLSLYIASSKEGQINGGGENHARHLMKERM